MNDRRSVLLTLKSAMATYLAVRNTLGQEAVEKGHMPYFMGRSSEEMERHFGIITEDGGEPIEQAVEATVEGYPDNARATIRQLLVAKIHEAFSVAADQLMQRGYLTEAERISLSSTIGRTLTYFNETVDTAAIDDAVDHMDLQAVAEKMITVDGKVEKGGPGSGHHGHRGRPGKRGGSLPASEGIIGEGGQIIFNVPEPENAEQLRRSMYMGRKKAKEELAAGSTPGYLSHIKNLTPEYDQREQDLRLIGQYAQRAEDAGTDMGDEDFFKKMGDEDLEFRHQVFEATQRIDRISRDWTMRNLPSDVGVEQAFDEIEAYNPSGWDKFETPGDVLYRLEIPGSDLFLQAGDEGYLLTRGLRDVVSKAPPEDSGLASLFGEMNQIGSEAWTEAYPEPKDFVNAMGIEYIKEVSFPEEDYSIFPEFMSEQVTKGGPGSGNFGHEGRPGEIGGSQPQDGAGEPSGEGDGTEAQEGTETGAEAEAQFNKEEWFNMGFKERKDRWDALSIQEKDALADPVNNIPRIVQERLSFAGERPNTGDIQADISTRLDQVGDFINADAREMIQATAEEMDIVLTNAGVSDELRRNLVMEGLDQLVVQDNESYRRTLGDHGINHIRGNIAASMQILNEVPGADPAEQVAAMYITHVFHDAGYLTPPAQTFLDKDHPRWGMQAYDANIRPWVQEALGDRVAGEVSHYIRSHYLTDINWEAEPVASAVRVSDNLAIFKDEKLPALWRFVPDNVNVLEDLSAGEISISQAQSLLRQNIQGSDLSDSIKDALIMATREVNPMTPDFTLGMLGGDIESFHWDEDHLLVNIERTPEADRLLELFDLGQRQWAKFSEPYGVPFEQFSETLDFEFADEQGNVLLEGRVVGAEKSIFSGLEKAIATARERVAEADLSRLTGLMRRTLTLLGGNRD